MPGATHPPTNVNSGADVLDANPGEGVCETAPGNHVCTLRAAIRNPSGCTDNFGATLTTDQSGLPRPIGSACDMGAYQVQPNLIFKIGFEAG